jgi:hypothetical protein
MTATNHAEFKRPSIREFIRTEAGRREFEDTFAWLRKCGVAEPLLEKTRAMLEPDSSPMNYPLVIEILQEVNETFHALFPRRLYLRVSNPVVPRSVPSRPRMKQGGVR